MKRPWAGVRCECCQLFWLVLVHVGEGTILFGKREKQVIISFGFCLAIFPILGGLRNFCTKKSFYWFLIAVCDVRILFQILVSLTRFRVRDPAVFFQKHVSRKL
jgi:hypothetical protein